MSSSPATLPTEHREVRLASRLAGELTPDHFRLTSTPVPRPGPGQIVVRNRVMAVTAAMRTMMTGAELPMPSYVPGEVLWGPAVGDVVLAAEGTGLVPGELVRTSCGWREYALVEAAEARRLDENLLPEPAAHLSQGATAWAALARVAGVRAGDTVFVTGAAGGVGSMAGQIARRLGAGRVVGSTGSAGKVEYLREELGYDAAVVRGGEPLDEQLRRAAPDGVDVLLDTVGGEQLRAAVEAARTGARFVLVGALSGQLGSGDGLRSPVELDSSLLITRRITLRGFSAHDHPEAPEEWAAEFGAGLRDGSLTFPHARLHGIDRAPRALGELVQGRHTGTVLVEL